MPFTDLGYGPVTIALMVSVFDAAWQEAQASNFANGQAEAARATMASTILAAVVNGERIPARLKQLALRSVAGPGPLATRARNG